MSKKKPKNPVKTYYNGSLKRHLTVEITGYNRAKLIKNLVKEGVTLKKVRVLDAKTTQIRISYKDSEKSFAICNRLCYTYRVVAQDGLIAFLKSNIKRLGLLVGVIVATVITFVSSCFIHEIEIESKGVKVGRLQLLDYLKANGVKVGSSLANFDRDEIETLVRAYDGVADCSVKIKGCTLTVTVLERDDSTPAVTAKENIVSSFDAVVTRVICSSGTAKVKTGAIVKSGEVLIEGKTYDQNGEELSVVPAIGSVYGRVSESYSTTVTTQKSYFRRTGRSKISVSFQIFGLNLFYEPSPYAYYDGVTTYAHLFGVKTTRTVYYETEKIVDELPIEEIESEYEDEVCQEFIAQYSGQPEKRTIIKPLGENAYKITVYLTTERIIS